MKTKLITTALLAALSITTIGAAAAREAVDAQVSRSGGERHHGHGPRGPGGDRVDALARFDTDDDGRISRAEAQAGQEAMQARRDAHRAERTTRGESSRAEGSRRDGTRDAEAQGARGHRGPAGARSHARGFDLVANFDAIDTDRDGYLTRSELRNWHTAKSTERRAEGERRFDAKFREADLNDDGKLSRVEVSEAMPRLAARFAWLDENRDGFLSREELRPTRPQR